MCFEDLILKQGYCNKFAAQHYTVEEIMRGAEERGCLESVQVSNSRITEIFIESIREVRRHGKQRGK